MLQYRRVNWNFLAQGDLIGAHTFQTLILALLYIVRLDWSHTLRFHYPVVPNWRRVALPWKWFSNWTFLEHLGEVPWNHLATQYLLYPAHVQSIHQSVWKTNRGITLHNFNINNICGMDRPHSAYFCGNTDNVFFLRKRPKFLVFKTCCWRINLGLSLYPLLLKNRSTSNSFSEFIAFKSR